MPGRSRRLALAASVDRFEMEVRQLAIELARGVIDAELARVAVSPEKEKQRPPRKVGRRAVMKVDADSAAKPPRTPMKDDRAPEKWTRDAVIAELGRWLISTKDIEPAFLKRHGPRGLVDAAKRIFGRFDAALNAANLAIAPRMQQDTRRPAVTRQAWPSMRDLARRQRDRRAAADAAAGESSGS